MNDIILNFVQTEIDVRVYELCFSYFENKVKSKSSMQFIIDIVPAHSNDRNKPLNELLYIPSSSLLWIEFCIAVIRVIIARLPPERRSLKGGGLGWLM